MLRLREPRFRVLFSHAFSKDGWEKILTDSARMEKKVRHRERKWAIERFERMRNRVRKVQFSREGAAVASADAASADAASFRIEKTRCSRKRTKTPIPRAFFLCT